jgi:chorismate binding enzyme
MLQHAWGGRLNGCLACAAGDVQADFWLAFDLLRSQKDHLEFSVVRDWVAEALRGVATSVSVDREKSVLKQGAVQHLYGRLSATLQPGRTDADLLVCLSVRLSVCPSVHLSIRASTCTSVRLSVHAIVHLYLRLLRRGPMRTLGWILLPVCAIACRFLH